jgi:hypothetical protein
MAKNAKRKTSVRTRTKKPNKRKISGVAVSAPTPKKPARAKALPFPPPRVLAETFVPKRTSATTVVATPQAKRKRRRSHALPAPSTQPLSYSDDTIGLMSHARPPKPRKKKKT